jgi:hypothetical protein
MVALSAAFWAVTLSIVAGLTYVMSHEAGNDSDVSTLHAVASVAAAIPIISMLTR